MKKKKIIIIISIILAFVVSIICYLLFKMGYINYFYKSSNEFILLKNNMVQGESKVQLGYVFKDYEDFKNKIDSDTLSKSDFKQIIMYMLNTVMMSALKRILK